MNEQQSLVYMFTKKGAKTDKEFSLGFSLEWECSIITGIVMNYHPQKLNVDTFVFLMYCNEDGVKIITDILLNQDEAKELATSPNFSPSFDMYEILESDTEVVSMKTSAEFHSTPVVSTVKRRDSMLSHQHSRDSVGHKKTVTFEERIRVVLTPKAKAIDMKTLFFSSAEFRRFQRDKTDEVEQQMQVNNCSKQEAVFHLYHPQDSGNEDVAKHTIENGFCLLESDSVLGERSVMAHQDSTRLSGTLDLLTSPHVTSSRDDTGLDDSVSSTSSATALSLGMLHKAPTPRRISMDDEVDRESFDRQQLDKEDQWQQFHVNKLQEFSRNRDKRDGGAKKKTVFPPRGFVLKRYLPPPKVIHPTVVYISLLRCQHLTPSIFWPIVSTDSYVTITVDGERQRSEIVRRKRNPKYNSTEVYTFALEYESTLHSYIDFEVQDESRTGGEDSLLGVARVAFASLRFQPLPRPPQKVTLPLCPTREALEAQGAGKGYFPDDGSSDGGDLQRIGIAHTRTVPLEKQKNVSCISVLIALVDEHQSSSFELLRSQDRETEERVGKNSPWIDGDTGRRTLSSEEFNSELAW